MKRFVMIIHGILLLSLMLLPACSDSPEPSQEAGSEVEETPTAARSRSIQLPVSAQHRIQTAPVKKRMLSKAMTAPGGVALDLAKMAKVSSRIEGQVEHIFVQLGNQVKKGDPLLAIGSLKLDELVQEFLVSQVQMDLRKANFERTQKLQAEQIVSERRLMEDRAHYLEAKAIYQACHRKTSKHGIIPK